MIEKIKILELVNSALEGSEKFLVSLKITPDNRIFVDIDGDNGVNIDDCIELSRAIESQLDRDAEDFELNVASAGLDSPLKLKRQYKKNVGRDLTVTTFEGETTEGQLVEADDVHITLQPQGSRKSQPKPVQYAYSDIKTAKIVIHF